MQIVGDLMKFAKIILSKKNQFHTLQNHLEQYTRKNSLEIHGIPKSAYTSTEEVVLEVANAHDVAVSSQDIETSTN